MLFYGGATLISRALCAINVLLHKGLVYAHCACHLSNIKFWKLIEHIAYGILSGTPFYYMLVHCCRFFAKIAHYS